MDSNHTNPSLDVRKLSDDELRMQLENFGVAVGAISSSTRPLYERQLIKKRTHSSENTNDGEKTTESLLGNEYNKPEPVIQSHALDADVYYGVYVPLEQRNSETDGIVYTDTANCITTMKKFPGARFKGFPTYEAALHFSFNGPPAIKITTTNGVISSPSFEAEKPSPFRGPKPQDLLKFRKAIEKGQLDCVLELINSNPRYLVSSADAPAILQEGFRYNAIHVTCRSNQPEICAKILEIVENHNIFQRLNPDEDVAMAITRSRHLLDLYLNTPDKGMNETPLHFACKNGFFECARILTSYVDCIKDMRNKYGETPNQVIFSRAKVFIRSVNEKIKSLFEEQVYVPVCRDEDNCLAPTVGSPFSLTSDQSPLNPTSPIFPISPLSSPGIVSPVSISPSYKLRGFGGPMSPKKAEVFYKRLRWSSIPSSSPKGKVATMRIADHEKGLERAGRNLAADLNVGWKEHWDFLGEFVNLSSPEGLQKLEAYLQKKYREVIDERNLKLSQECLSYFEDISLQDCEAFDTSEISNISSMSSIQEICKGLEALRLNVSLSPSKESIDYRSPATTQIDSPSEFSHNNNELSHKELDNSSMSVETDAASFYNYCFRSAQISAQKVGHLLLDLSEDLQNQAPTDVSIMRNFLRNELSPEVFNLREIIHNYQQDSNIKSFDLSFLHLQLAAGAVENIMKDLSPHNLFELSLAFENRAVNNALDYFKIEDDEGLSSGEKADRVQHLSCTVIRLSECLSLAMNSLKIQETEKIELKHLNKCSCAWSFTPEEKSRLLEFRSIPIDSSLVATKMKNTPKSSNKSSSRIKKVTSWLHRFLFGGEEDDVTVDSTVDPIFEQPITRQLSFDEEAQIDSQNEDADTCSDSFETAPSSTDEGKVMVTPEERITFYIDGTVPSKVDLDVLNAIEDVVIDEELYPRITEWTSLISATPQETKNSWASPCCRRVNRSINTKWDTLPPTFGPLDDSFSSDQLRRSILTKPNLPRGMSDSSDNFV